MFGLLVTLFIFYCLLTPITDLLTTNIHIPLTRFSMQDKYISSFFAPKARLGNNLFEYAAILGIAQQIGRTPIIYIDDENYLNMLNTVNRTIPGLVDKLVIKHEKFPKAVKPTVFNTRCCVYQDTEVLKSIDQDLIILDGFLYQSYKYFSEMREKMRSYLSVPKNKFENLPKSTANNFINCIHIRRGDFLRNGFHFASEDFIRKAVKLIGSQVAMQNRQIHNVLFGDDYDFMRNMTFNKTENGKEQFHFISQNSPSDDLLYAKDHCNSVLISASHSTFGWWMGYFSKGDKVYYTDIRATNHSVYLIGSFNPFDYYPPHWTPLKYDYDLNVIESKN